MIISHKVYKKDNINTSINTYNIMKDKAVFTLKNRMLFWWQ